MRQQLKTIMKDSRGATAIEYGLICSLIVVAIIVAVSTVAEITIDMWDNVAEHVVNTH